MRPHKFAAARAGNKRWSSKRLIAPAIPAAVARHFGFWYGTHDGENS
jgi:hypothetical protein